MLLLDADETTKKGIIMNQQDIIHKLNGIKGNLQHLLSRKWQQHGDESEEEMEVTGADNYLDDLPLTINRDPSPGVKFYATENSEIARGAPKENAHGIDRFGEEDTY